MDDIKHQHIISTRTLPYPIPSDCRSETRVTVGLIDAIISISRILAQRDLSAPEIQEALKDLRQDEDLGKVLNG